MTTTSDETPPVRRERPIATGLVLATGAAGLVLVAVAFRSMPVLAALLVVMVAVSTWLSKIDVAEHRLPNNIVGPLAAAVTIAVIVGGLVEGDLGRSGRALGFGLALSAALFVASIIGGLGMGDVKYGFPMAATLGWFGLEALFLALFVMSLSGAIVAAGVLMTKRGRGTNIPYGPFMALGLVLGLLASAPW